MTISQGMCFDQYLTSDPCDLNTIASYLARTLAVVV